MTSVVFPTLLAVVVGTLCASTTIPRRSGTVGEGAVGDQAKNPDAAFCADACAAGLGAPRCGDAATFCRPPTLINATAAHLADLGTNVKGAERRGKPREDLCPKLCPLALGDPLCRCNTLRCSTPSPAGRAQAHDWLPEACDALCTATGKAPSGCPSCPADAAVSALAAGDIDWDLWCHILCLEGDGGLACLCDINP